MAIYNNLSVHLLNNHACDVKAFSTYKIFKENGYLFCLSVIFPFVFPRAF